MASQLDTSELLTLWKGCINQTSHDFYAVVLPPGLDVEPVSFSPGATTHQELGEKVQEEYGADALHVTPYRFNRALRRRKTHRQKLKELLCQYHSVAGNDLRTYVVYGSSSRPLSIYDIHSLTPYGAIPLSADKGQDGYYTYIAVPQFLPEEQENAYELEFISRPLVMKPKT